MRREPKTVSQTRQAREYHEYFDSVCHTIDKVELSQRLISNDIEISSEADRSGMKVETLGVNRRGAIVRFRVQIGQFKVKVVLLNVPQYAPQRQQSILYQGGPVTIIERKAVTQGTFVCKQTRLLQNVNVLKVIPDGIDWRIVGGTAQIEDVVFECAFGKLCSALGVGVKLGSPDHHFDIVCWEDCIEFYMERCDKLSEEKCRFGVPELELRLKYCVAVMHSFGLIHKDIKPDNMLVTSQGKIVLADFNISTPSAVQPGQKMFTYREGTQAFMSPAMMMLNNHSCGLVDLYYNDMWGLKKAIFVLQSNWQQSCTTGHRPPTKDIDPFTIAMFELSSILQNSPKQKASSITTKLFSEYFREFGSHIDESAFNPTFLIRALGVGPKLIYYLQQESKPSPQSQRLLKNLLYQIDNPTLSLQEATVPQQVGPLRKLYQRALLAAQQLNKQSVEQKRECVCKLGLALVSSLLEIRHSEDAVEILANIEGFIAQEQQQEFEALSFNTEILRLKPDWQRIMTLGQAIPATEILLVKGAIYCFEKAELGWCIWILEHAFSKEKPQNPTAVPEVNKILEFVEELLHRPLSTEVWILVWELFTLQAINFIQPCRIINFAARRPLSPTIPRQCRLQIVIGTFQALRLTSQNREGLKKLKQAAELALELLPKWNRKCLYLQIEMVCIMHTIQSVDNLRFQALALLRYVEAVVDQSDLFRSLVLNVIVKLESQFGDQAKCLEYSSEALKILRYSKILTPSSLQIAADVSTTLVSIIDMCKSQPKAYQVVVLLEWYSSFPKSLLLRMSTLLFRILMNLSIIWHKCADMQKSQSYELLALSMLENCNGKESLQYAKVMASMCEPLSKHFLFQKAIKFAVMTNQIAQRELQHCDLQSALYLCKILPYLRAKERGVLDFTIRRIKEEPTNPFFDLQHGLATNLFDKRMYEEAYAVSKPQASQTQIGNYLCARCLFFLGKKQESEHLFQMFIQQTNGVGTFQMLRFRLCSFRHLRQYSTIKGDIIAAEKYFKNTIQIAKNAIERRRESGSLTLLFQVGTIMRFEECRLICLKARKILLEASMAQNASLYIRCECLDTVTKASYIDRQYKIAFDCMIRRIILIGKIQESPQSLFKMAICAMSLGKSRHFYRAAKKLKQMNQNEYFRLRDIVVQQKDIVKLYVLEGIMGESCAIQRVARWWQHPERLTQEFVECTMKDRLRVVVLTKKLVIAFCYFSQPNKDMQKMKSGTLSLM